MLDRQVWSAIRSGLCYMVCIQGYLPEDCTASALVYQSAESTLSVDTAFPACSVPACPHRPCKAAHAHGAGMQFATMLYMHRQQAVMLAECAPVRSVGTAFHLICSTKIQI